MTDYLFDAPKVRSVPVQGADRAFPVNRIFCVGRNYAAHAAEMGVEADREAPFYFTKSPTACCPTGATIPYPTGTSDLHHEMELVMVIGKPVFRASLQDAGEAIFAYGCGLDMTRRDLQQQAKDKRRPWDLGKDFENAAVLSPLTRASEFGAVGPQRIHLSVNGQLRQDALLSDMIHGVREIVADLSKFYHLVPGDLIMTGTPAGVGAVSPGDRITGGIDGLDPIELTIGAPE
ncbi:fumarylacetoacetate hydrolase family protein [Thalassovita sp.]|uniref:fumarylacetoacetate hydrolase family protein n=1 Tax=Thalassovita sp. TaxID=1979401 RepID=UPI0029DE5E6A|nr:fumarylacetoacetate hydrolase family protein [Thalassovita sp.]